MARVEASQCGEQLAVGEGVGVAVGPGQGQRGLADAGWADHTGHGDRAFDTAAVLNAVQPGQLHVPAGERAGRGGQLGRDDRAVDLPAGPGRRRQPQRRIVAQHLLVQLAQLGAGIDAQFLARVAMEPPIRDQRVDPTRRPVLGQHQQAEQPLPERMIVDQPAQLADHLGVPAQLQVGRDPLFHGDQPQLVDVGLAGLLQLRAGQHRAAPQVQRLPEQLGPLGRRPTAGVADQPLGPMQVDQLGLHLEHVAGRLGANGRGATGLGQDAPELRDVTVHDRASRLRRLVPPERIHDTVERDHLVGVEHQQREQAAHAGSAERGRTPVDQQLYRTEHAELEHGTCSLDGRGRQHHSGQLPEASDASNLREAVNRS